MIFFASFLALFLIAVVALVFVLGGVEGVALFDVVSVALLAVLRDNVYKKCHSGKLRKLRKNDKSFIREKKATTKNC